jgi:pimeloyl-ACP methyl ester carboxylesterase
MFKRNQQFHLSDGRELGFDEHGAPVGRPIPYAEAPAPAAPLVILHAFTGALDTFAPLIPTLAQQTHIYALDLRGHNLSAHTPGAYQVAEGARDVAAFLQRVVGQPAWWPAIPWAA